ncbi:MAG: DUF1501 domain-containing protein [Phycisphaerae bacterium]|nr:DUF1501 domain-containing protein [Phycisphaerae bacterium]
MDLCNNRLPTPLSRRDLLRNMACGFGYLAFAGIAHSAWAADVVTDPLAPKSPHFPARAKRVIFLYMAGGPSHVDTFDYKPKLITDDGKSYGRGLRAGAKLLSSPWKFRQHGTNGLWISDLFPEVAKHADELCLLRGMKTDVPAHAQASMKMHTGSFQFVRPSMGAWTLYGLGTLNKNLPGFVTIDPPSQNGGAQNYGSSFLPAMYQGVPVSLGRRNRGRAVDSGDDDAISNIGNDRFNTKAQREQLDLVQRLNKERLKREKNDLQTKQSMEGVIESYELAFRMQAEVPDLLDFASESKATLDAYGIGAGNGSGDDKFARQCLMARRFAEAGVRFIEVAHGGWDTHRNLRDDLTKQCGEVDRPIAALLGDLKKRGMLDDTLVVWGGEFGRTPYAQNGDGRDHNNKGFTTWMAGAGVKGGFSYGATDDYGLESVDGVVDIHDWHATMLHLLGLDHEKLTYQHAGRDFRLTDVKGNVRTDILT